MGRGGTEGKCFFVLFYFVVFFKQVTEARLFFECLLSLLQMDKPCVEGAEPIIQPQIHFTWLNTKVMCD